MIPTAEEMLIKYLSLTLDNDNVTPKQHYKKWKEIYPELNKRMLDAFKEFAKAHVEAALRAAHSEHQVPIEDLDFTLQAYPLSLVK